MKNYKKSKWKKQEKNDDAFSKYLIEAIKYNMDEYFYNNLLEKDIKAVSDYGFDCAVNHMQFNFDGIIFHVSYKISRNGE